MRAAEAGVGRHTALGGEMGSLRREEVLARETGKGSEDTTGKLTGSVECLALETLLGLAWCLHSMVPEAQFPTYPAFPAC